MDFVVCGKLHVTFLIIRALYVFCASTYDVISHLIPITSMNAEVVDGGRCLFYFYYLFIFFIYLHIPGGGMEEERGAPREKNESAADKDSSSPESAIFFNSSLKFTYISWPYSGTYKAHGNSHCQR